MHWARTARYLLCAIVVMADFIGQAGLCGTRDTEDALGRKYAEQVKKDYKMISDGAALERVQRIGKELAAIANQTEVPAGYGSSEVCKFDYEFSVVEDKDPNAFSLPGGKIYVNTGLLDMVTTDDELAGVIAHEIAHSAHHHVAQIMRQQDKIDKYVALVALVGIMTNTRSQDLNNVLLGASMLRQGQVSGYTMQAERDADRTAVAYLAKSSFSPMGMVDFMRKLETMHDQNPTLPLGIYQTHPAPFRRVASIRKALQDLGIKVDMRKLRGIAYANAVESTTVKGEYTVSVCGRSVYTPASLGGKSTSKERADTIAQTINDVMDSEVRPEEITIDEASKSLAVKGKVLLRVEAGDLAGSSQGTGALLNRARSALIRAAWADWLINTCDVNQDVEP